MNQLKGHIYVEAVHTAASGADIKLTRRLETKIPDL